MPSPILARADALMRRQRQNDGEPDEIPVLTDALDDDIPVLLDIDEALLAPADLPPAAETATPVAAAAPLDLDLPDLAPFAPSVAEAALPEPEQAEPRLAETAPSEPPVTATPPAESALSDPASPAPADPDALLRELSVRLQSRLTAELPRLIEATLRDYLAERAMLADLPPDQRD